MPSKTPAETKESLEIQKLKLEVATLKFNAEKTIAEYERDQASADSARIYPLNGEISTGSVKYAVDRITEWYRHDPTAPIDLVINSGGGSIFAGMALFDYIRMIREQGCQINTMAVGIAASMAAILLQAGSTRYISENSWLMIHEGSTMTWGKTSELRDEADLMEKIQGRMIEILAERSTLSAKQIRQRSLRKDWWITAAEAVELGFADEVR